MKTISSSVLAELAGSHLRVLIFVELSFASGVVRLCNADWNVPWNGQTWIGTASMGSVEEIIESSQKEVNGLRLTLAGTLPGITQIALAEYVQGRPAKIWQAFLTESNAIISDPVLVYKGRIDTMQPTDAKDQSVVVLNLEDRMADFKRPRVRRFNTEDQLLRRAGDLFFNRVPENVEKQVIWGNKEFFKRDAQGKVD